MLDRVRFSYDLVAKKLAKDNVDCFISYSGETVKRQTTKFMRKLTLHLFSDEFCNFVINNNIGVVVIIDPPSKFCKNQLKLRIKGVKFVWYSRYGFHETFQPVFYKQMLKYIFHRLTVWSEYWAISKDIEYNLHRREKIPASKITLIRNGIDSEIFTPSAVTNIPDHFDEDSFKVLYVAQFRPEKRLDFFIDIASLFIAKHPTAKIIFIHLGKGDTSTLKQEVEKLGIDDKVKFEGVSNNVKGYMKLADVYLHVSSKEGICNSISEAMLMELPVICARIGGNIEQVIDGKTGYLVDKDKASGFVNKLEFYMNKKDLINEHGKAGRLRIRSDFSVENQVRGISDALKKLVG
ncbi:glycosyltransferase family 4 protein [Alteromonas gilva]|uniref:Glycosyltransferase family 4 protein n=1 Tax=Alteromonas gilva TaxID=2987522 RepID=A0ABT5KZZ7_9ALTE|nr:glycosyltransferase family 4 protein [Alteromonas gilva]MDC8830340.1 glycosyltransferase family 4 protein [Alteromonas gilva]